MITRINPAVGRRAEHLTIAELRYFPTGSQAHVLAWLLPVAYAKTPL